MSDFAYATSQKGLAYAKTRRAGLAAKGLCLNGAAHGPRTHGPRCAWCDAVKTFGLDVVLELEIDGKAPDRPPGYRPRQRLHDEGGDSWLR